MLNIFFWMILLFTASVVTYNLWLRADTQQETAMNEEVQTTQTASAEEFFAESIRSVKNQDMREVLAFITIPENKPAEYLPLDLYTPVQEEACAVYDMQGRRVA